MTIFPTTLPDEVLDLLRKRAEKLSIPKNRIIEKALRIYLDHLNRAEYVQSYKKASKDSDKMNIAEEGMEEYFNN